MSPDAFVVGSGPNGLAAAVVLARAGIAVRVLEASKLGGGLRTDQLTLPGFLHDVCSTVHPLGISSPFFRTLPLAEFGLEWVQPPAPLAHPFDDGTAVTLERSVEDTAAQLGADGAAYRKLVEPLVKNWDALLDMILAPPRWPRHPLGLARFGLHAIRSAQGLRAKFRGQRAAALLAGTAAHSVLPLDMAGSAAFVLVLAAAAHAVGWPIARGGSQRLADALAAHLRSLGGKIVEEMRVVSIDDLPSARAVLCDVSTRGLLQIAGHRFPAAYRKQLQRYRYGPGAFKMDWALDGPIPWRAAECARAATVHLGGTFEEIAESEMAPWRGLHAERPFVILVQPTLFDPTRAPAGKHTAWAYCHVPNASTVDMSARIEAQVERFAPGFRDRILARSVLPPQALEEHNPNLVGGDISGGAQTLRQLFVRPTPRLYSTPVGGLYICSASTPPGGGVHGMCGFFAAQRALTKRF